MLFLFLFTAFAAKEDFVNLRAFDATIATKQKCLLRSEVAEKLSRVQSNLRLQGYQLRISGCYDPQATAGRVRGTGVDVALEETRGQAPLPRKKTEKLLRRAFEKEGFVSQDAKRFDVREWENLPTQTFSPDEIP